MSACAALAFAQPKQPADAERYPADYPEAARSIDPRRPGVPQMLPKNPPPLRGDGERGDRWSIKIGKVSYAVEVWATNLPHIMNMEFLPTGELMLAERRGEVRLVRAGVPAERALLKIDDVYFEGDSGLMSLCLHPKFAENGWVYVYFVDKQNNDCRVVRHTLKDETLVDAKVILSGIPKHHFHAAGTIRFGPDDKLFVTTGDCWKMDDAQDPMSLAGKFLRLNDDGSVPSDNPFVGKGGYRQELFALGSRNAQGMDWQPGSGRLFATEHGPSGEKIRPPRGGHDEFNLVTPGCNLGWPVIHAKFEQEGMVSPTICFENVVAPGSGMFYTGDVLEKLKGDYFVGCLRGHALMRIELDGANAKDWSTVLEDLGRMRALAQGPLDFEAKPLLGAKNLVLYFASSNADRYGAKGPNDDRIFRLIPEK